MKKTHVVALTAIFFAAPVSAQSLGDVLRTVNRVAQGGPLAQGARGTAPTDRGAPLDPKIANGRVAGFNIAGIRLGMTPQQAIAQGAQAGFRLNNSSNGASFAGRRLEALRARRPDFAGSAGSQIVKGQYFQGAQGDSISVEYAAMPEGPRVERILYQFDPAKIDRAELERTILRKFGSPNGRATMVGDSLWCDKQCGEGEAQAGYSPGVFNMLSIDGRIPAQRHISGLIKADVERLTPKVRSGI